jgi:hypothetical protein
MEAMIMTALRDLDKKIRGTPTKEREEWMRTIQALVLWDKNEIAFRTGSGSYMIRIERLKGGK